MSRLIGLIVVLLLFGTLAAGVVAAADDDPAAEPEEMDPDRIVIEIRIDETGDAVWSVTYLVELDTDRDRDAFAELVEEIESDPAPYEDRYRERMDRAAAAAAIATGREMTIDDLSVSAELREIPEAQGIVAYRFSWTNFAAVDGNSLVIGDAIEGLFLDSRTVLIIGWPEGYAIDGISPPAVEERSNSVLWRGPTEFGTGEPRVSVSEPGMLSIGRALALAAIALIGGAIALAYRRAWIPIDRFRSQESAGSSTPADLELLSNEEQVLQVLESRGGRMKQRELADELGWTAAKTSQVTGDLRDSGKLEGFRLGRENVLRIPDEGDGEEA